MAYFKVDIPCSHYPDDWKALLDHVHQNWEPNWVQSLPDLTYPVEAKALAIFSVARRLVQSAQALAVARSYNNTERWDLVFVESSIVLFPMIELMGLARMGNSDASSRNLIAGIEWLRDPLAPPSGNTIRQMRNDTTRLSSLGQHMKVHSRGGPLVSDVFDTRNYFIHGLKEGDISYIPNVLNYELPMSIVRESQRAMKVYWEALRADNGTADWVQNLANAEIHPFVIQGSGYFDKGLLDPEILTAWLEK